jgi:hypothetical protein
VDVLGDAHADRYLCTGKVLLTNVDGVLVLITPQAW